MLPYSMDLRERMLQDSLAGMSTEEVARKYRVSNSSVNRLKRLHKETGSAKPKKIGGYRKSPLEARREDIARFIAEKPDLTLAELKQKLDMEISLQALSKFTRAKMGISFKKKRFERPKRIGKM